MMNAQARWQLLLPERPSQAGQDRNNKLSLKSGVIDWLEKNGLGWSHESVGSQSGRFVNTLTDVLWYIDGHQEALKARACHIPAEFEIFVGFNNPEKSKHRKREYTNLQNGDSEILLQPTRRYHASTVDVLNKMAVSPRSSCLTFRKHRQI